MVYSTMVKDENWSKGLSGYDFSLLNRLVWYTEVYQIFQSIPTGVKVIWNIVNYGNSTHTFKTAWCLIGGIDL